MNKIVAIMTIRVKEKPIMTFSTKVSSIVLHLTNFNIFNTLGNGREMTRMINTHIEASKIGRQIAEQVLDYQRRMGDHSSESSPDPDPTLAQTVSLVSESQLNASLINMENNSGSSETPTRINGTYSNFSSYTQQQPRSNLENGKILLLLKN